jgi:hypothetical protein
MIPGPSDIQSKFYERLDATDVSGQQCIDRADRFYPHGCAPPASNPIAFNTQTENANRFLTSHSRQWR